MYDNTVYCMYCSPGSVPGVINVRLALQKFLKLKMPMSNRFVAETKTQTQLVHIIN
jgi:hypothetical protein